MKFVVAAGSKVKRIDKKLQENGISVETAARNYKSILSSYTVSFFSLLNQNSFRQSQIFDSTIFVSFMR